MVVIHEIKYSALHVNTRLFITILLFLWSKFTVDWVKNLDLLTILVPPKNCTNLGLYWEKGNKLNTFQFPCIGMLVRLDRRGMMMIKEKLRLLLTIWWSWRGRERGVSKGEERHVDCPWSLIKVWCMLISNAWLANLVNQLHNSWQDIMLRKCTSLLNFFINEWLLVSNLKNGFHYV